MKHIITLEQFFELKNLLFEKGELSSKLSKCKFGSKSYILLSNKYNRVSTRISEIELEVLKQPLK